MDFTEKVQQFMPIIPPELRESTSLSFLEKALTKMASLMLAIVSAVLFSSYYAYGEIIYSYNILAFIVAKQCHHNFLQSIKGYMRNTGMFRPKPQIVMKSTSITAAEFYLPRYGTSLSVVYILSILAPFLCKLWIFLLRVVLVSFLLTLLPNRQSTVIL